MLFTLEALNAREGDCLLLMYGTAKRPRVVLIDGGPRVTYAESLLPRLTALREQLGYGDDPLPIELMVVTHVDSDHIGGALALTSALRAAKGVEGPMVTIKELWHNSFDDALGRAAVADAVAFVDALPESDRKGITASVGEGRSLREDADALGISVNAEFAGLVARGDTGGAEIPCGDGLTLTVLGPARAQLEALQREWEAARSRAKKGDGRTAGLALDSSEYNLGSITMLAECGERTMLLAGDARGDHVVAGLEAAGKLPAGGTMFVDVFKLPHHASCRNVTPELLRRVIADTYVISANGKHGNPDFETLERIEAARAGAAYTVVCTFPERAYAKVEGDSREAEERREALKKFDAWARRQPDDVKFVYREADALGVTLDLGDESLA